jgi:deoxycytidylate deaminase
MCKCGYNNTTNGCNIPIHQFEKENQFLHNYIHNIHDKIKNDSTCSQHICMICKGKKALCFGFNQIRAKIKGFRCSSVHAEFDAVSKLGRYTKKAKKKTKNYRVFIVRYKKDENTNQISYYKSNPCIQCTNMLRACKFKKIYATTNKGDLKKICLNENEEFHVSSLVRALDELNPSYLHILYRNQSEKHHEKVGKRLLE